MQMVGKYQTLLENVGFLSNDSVIRSMMSPEVGHMVMYVASGIKNANDTDEKCQQNANRKSR
jgi:hypothetical protein